MRLCTDDSHPCSALAAVVLEALQNSDDQISVIRLFPEANCVILGTRLGSVYCLARVHSNNSNTNIEPVWELPQVQRHAITGIVWSPYLHVPFAIFGIDPFATLVDISGQKINRCEGHNLPIVDAHWLPNTPNLVTCSLDGTIGLFDTKGILHSRILLPSTSIPLKLELSDCSKNNECVTILTSDSKKYFLNFSGNKQTKSTTSETESLIISGTIEEETIQEILNSYHTACAGTRDVRYWNLIPSNSFITPFVYPETDITDDETARLEAEYQHLLNIQEMTKRGSTIASDVVDLVPGI